MGLNIVVSHYKAVNCNKSVDGIMKHAKCGATQIKCSVERE